MTSKWYVVCRFTTVRKTQDDVVPWPSSVAHAKQMGGTMTACGQNAATWARLFHVAFPTTHGDNCPACLDALSASRPVGGRTGARTPEGPAPDRPRATGSPGR